MGKYIDAGRLKYEIERRNLSDYCTTTERYEEKLYEIIDSLEQEEPEQPEYGYLSTTYIHGKKASWNVGDTLAYYECTSNEEGEIIIGKITEVEFSNEEGWVYTFEDGNTWDEQSLVEEEVYKIIEK